MCSLGQTPPFKKCIREEILGFLFSAAATCGQLCSNPSSRERLWVPTCTGAQSHPPAQGMASNPPFPVVQDSSGLRAGLDMGTVAEKGNPREAEPSGPTRTVPVPLSSPLQREQILRGFSSFKHSPAPPFPQGIPMLLHFYIHPERKTEKRSCASSWLSTLDPPGSIPCLLFPRSLVLAVPPLPRHRGIGGKLVFLKKNTEAALLNPSFSPVSTGMWC